MNLQLRRMRIIAGSAPSVFRQRGVHFIRPGEDAALEVPDLAEAGLAQELDGLGRALSAAAVRDDFARAVELVRASRQLSQRDQMAAEVADLILVRLADVEDEDLLAAVQTRLQLAGGDFRHLRGRRRSLLAADAAELFVVDQFGDG